MGWFENFRREKRASDPIYVEQDAEGAISSGGDEAPKDADSIEPNTEVNSRIELNEETTEEFQTAFPRALKEALVENVAEGFQASEQTVSHSMEVVSNDKGKETKIIAIINQKGGVGKSTTAVNLSAALGEFGKSVLLIDLDPQGNATSGLGVEKGQLNRCIYDVLLNDEQIENILITDVFTGLDLVPATINLAGAEVELVSEMARENRLKDAVEKIRGRYDYVFVDCPPSLGLLTVNALVGSDALIIPIQTEFYALEGVTKLLESMKRVKNRLNTKLEIFGILLTMYDGRTTLSRQVAAEVRNYFGEKVFETIIPRTVKLSEAPSYGIPIGQYDPSGKGAQSYNDLAKEVIKRG